MNVGTLNIMIIVLLTFATCNALTIATLNNSEITKREVNPHDLFPDWVPFKNKHGADLGEFTSTKRKKPKKRLAQPNNFVMSPSDGEDDDYYAKGLDDSEDVYESKDWSDLHRPVYTDTAKISINLNNSDLVDIEGIVYTSTQKPKMSTEYEDKMISHGRRDRERHLHRDPQSTRLNFEDPLFSNPKMHNHKNQNHPRSKPSSEHIHDEPTIIESNVEYKQEESKKESIDYEADNHKPTFEQILGESIPQDPVLREPIPQEPALSKPIPQEPELRKIKSQEPASGEPASGEPASGEPASGELAHHEQPRSDPILYEPAHHEPPSYIPPRQGLPRYTIKHRHSTPSEPMEYVPDQYEYLGQRPKGNDRKQRKNQPIPKERKEKRLKVEDYDEHVPISYTQDEKKRRSIKEKRDENSKEHDHLKVDDDEEYSENVHGHAKREGSSSEKESEKTQSSKSEDEYDDQNKSTTPTKKKDDAPKENLNKKSKAEEDEEYSDEANTEKKEATSKEKQENEERKKRVLNAVDLLKERHAKEQRLLTERLREEELERDNSPVIDHFNKYSLNNHKLTDFDDYEQENSFSVKDKYKLQPLKKSRTSSTTTTPSSPEIKVTKKMKKTTNTDTLSIFKNPRPYMVTDDDYSADFPETTTKSTNRSETTTVDLDKISVYTASSNDDSLSPNDVAIPENVIPFYSQNKRVGKIRKKPKNYMKIAATTMTSSTPSVSTEEVKTKTEPFKVYIHPFTAYTVNMNDTGNRKTENLTDNKYVTASLETTTTTVAQSTTTIEIETSPPTTTTSTTTTTTTTEMSAETQTEHVPSSSTELTTTQSTTTLNDKDVIAEGSKKEVIVVDSAPAPSETKEAPKDSHSEKGGEKEFYEEHGQAHEEHSKKAYEGMHKDTRTEKGHHDKEEHKEDHVDDNGHDLHHHDEKEHYGAHIHEEKGKKHATYEESGKHSKGHNTKGSHDIHKKEEYEKRVEFFEEDGDSDEEEYSGGHIHKRDHASGGHFKKANLDAFNDDKEGGEKGFFSEGGSHETEKGYKSALGKDSHGKRGVALHGRGGKRVGRKWIFHQGHPAKTANLVLIDRRGDGFHNPLYYG